MKGGSRSVDIDLLAGSVAGSKLFRPVNAGLVHPPTCVLLRVIDVSLPADMEMTRRQMKRPLERWSHSGLSQAGMTVVVCRGWGGGRLFHKPHIYLSRGGCLVDGVSYSLPHLLFSYPHLL